MTRDLDPATAGRPPVATDSERLLLHVTTTDISLELLLGPQLRAFRDAGWDVQAASAPGDYVALLERDGIAHHPLRHATRAMAPHRDLAALVELWRLFRRLRPAVVHTHNPKPGVYGRIAARLAGVPLVVNTQHGLYAQPQDAPARRLLVYLLERLAAAFSDVELVQNPEDLETLARLRVRRSKLVLLGNGVDLDRFRPRPELRAAVRSELGIPDDGIVVGAVGRLVEEKGYLELFEAVGPLLARHERLHVLVVGPFDPSKADSVDRADLEGAVGAGVLHLGLRHDVERLYQALDLYVLASHREGYPRSAMEAAACGLPIVATDIRGCRQVVDHGVTGLLVPVRSPGELASAIDELVTDPDRRARMGAAAAARALELFSDRQVIARSLAAYASTGRRWRTAGHAR